MSPNTIARVGQAAWQAVSTSPSTIGRRSVLGVDFGMPNPLHAVGAFLHHAARADRHVRVVLQSRCSVLESRRRPGN